jgi:hypothetical protein
MPRRTRIRVAEADSTVKEAEWLFLKGCECKIQICGEGIFILLQKWDSAWICLGVVFKSSIISVKWTRYIELCNDLSFDVYSPGNITFQKSFTYKTIVFGGFNFDPLYASRP